MKIFKLISTFILCIFVLVAAGCSKNEINKPTSKEDGLQKTETVSIEPSSFETQDGKFEIVKSDDIEGWKTLKAAAILCELDEEGTYSRPLSADDIEKNKDKVLEYTIDFPGNWTLNSSVFDENGKKVAEIPPAILLKSKQESKFLDYELTDFDEELISKEAKQLGSNKMAKVVTKTQTEAGSWYPHVYKISDGVHGFSISFYSEKINKEDQELFDKIASTFAFKK